MNRGMVIHLLMRFKPDSGSRAGLRWECRRRILLYLRPRVPHGGKWSPWSVLDKHNVTPSECPHAIINVPGDYTYMPPTGTANR